MIIFLPPWARLAFDEQKEGSNVIEQRGFHGFDTLEVSMHAASLILRARLFWSNHRGKFIYLFISQK